MDGSAEPGGARSRNQRVGAGVSPTIGRHRDAQSTADQLHVEGRTKISSTDAMIAVLGKEFEALDVEIADTIRIAAHNVPPGLLSDEGEGDDWPAIRAKIGRMSSAHLAGLLEANPYSG